MRCVDDVFVAVASWTGIPRTRDGLGVLAERAAQTRLAGAVAVCRQVREVPEPPMVSITVNFVGARNYSTEEIKSAVRQGIRPGRDLRFVERDCDAHVNVRIFIEREQASVGVRLGPRPLRVRPYTSARVPGSLKPPVAAAMIRLSLAGSDHVGAVVG